MEIKKNMVFESVNTFYMTYFIPKKFINNHWDGLILDKGFNIIDWSSYSEDFLTGTDDFKLAEKTLDTIYIGSIIKYGDTFQKVLGRIGNIVFLSDGCDYENIDEIGNDISFHKTIEGLKEKRWEITGIEEEIEELTLEKVCEELGRTIKIIK